jgi:hypothetical protein
MQAPAKVDVRTPLAMGLNPASPSDQVGYSANSTIDARLPRPFDRLSGHRLLADLIPSLESRTSHPTQALLAT